MIYGGRNDFERELRARGLSRRFAAGQSPLTLDAILRVNLEKRCCILTNVIITRVYDNNFQFPRRVNVFKINQVKIIIK